MSQFSFGNLIYAFFIDGRYAKGGKGAVDPFSWIISLIHTNICVLAAVTPCTELLFLGQVHM